MNALWRLVLRCVHPFTRKGFGAAVAVLWEGRVLVVRLSYRKGLSLPGGRVGKGETPEQAAVRELAEEVGLTASPDELRSVYATLSLRIFEYAPSGPPEIRIDNQEVIEAKLVDPADIKEADETLRSYLQCRIPEQYRSS
ncbi:MAG: NUDIX hydrolase [Planctomycetota bacterium]|nr:NUDIX hydrolase [Planctomycetota bacterium]